MWTKIYLAVLALSIVVMGFFSFYSWSWLQSIGAPASAAAGHAYYAGIAWPILWISTVVLLMLGNAVLWTAGRAWALWTTFSFFALFIALRYFWLDRSFIAFQLENGLRDSGFSAAPLMAVLLIGVMAAIVFFQMFLVIRFRSKAYPVPAIDEKENSRSEKTES